MLMLPILTTLLFLITLECMRSFTLPKSSLYRSRYESLVLFGRKQSDRWKREDLSPVSISPISRPSLYADIFTLDDNSRQNISIPTDYKISLSCDVVRFYYEKSKGANASAIIDLYSTVHVGESQYYEQMVQGLQEYNIVLYELITSRENIFENHSFPYQKRLNKLLYSKQTEEIAQQFEWNQQMILPMMNPNWYIADLDSETINELESMNLSKVWWNYYWSIIAGRSFSQRFLTKFMVSDSWFLSCLRLLTWLTPCPEINSLLIDWARVWPRAGGISPFLLPILHKVSKFQWLDASRLAFTQQMLSGLADSGSWGGEARSDIAVRVMARNQECCRILNSFLSDVPSQITSPIKIAILYGAYHIDDLKRRFVEELRLKPEANFQKSFTAWSVSSIEDEEREHLTDSWSKGKQENLLKLLDFPTISVLSLSALAYVGFGVFDWWIGIELIVKASEIIFSKTEEVNDKIVFLSATIAYIVLYTQRHLFCLRKISYVGIQWDRGLFADV